MNKAVYNFECYLNLTQMKTKSILLTLGILAGATFAINAQEPDTLAPPAGIGSGTDPKATPDRSKVLIDTSTKVVDSLMHEDKKGKHKAKSDPMQSDKPIKIKRAPVDSARTEQFH